MAMIETWLKTDLQHVVRVQSLDGNLFSADNAANRVGVILTDNGQPSNIVGGISAYLIRPDEATLIISGQSSSNRAWVDLPASAYVKVGPFSLVIKNGTTTIGACTGYIYRTTTDEIVDPGHVIPSIDELLAELENMRSATRAAEAAVGTANTAAANANEKASAANTAAGAANTAATNANEKASAANTAAGAANTAATNANEKASAANTAASAANTAATNANEKASAANTAAANANEKASAANTAATNANAKASAADTAATNANEKASAANTAASAANAAAGKIDNMTVAANGLNPGSNPTAAISEVSGHKHILFGIPKGDTGATPGITVGTVTTLQPNQQATVELDQSSTPEAPVFNFGIPKGDTGTIQNAYASTLEMSPSDSRKIGAVIDTKTDKDPDAVEGNFAAFDANGNPVDSGHKHSDYLTQHQDISGKADKDADAVEGNFASFDANGNPVDSGHKHSDYLTQHQDISGKADKDADAAEGNFASFDANGNPVDSGHKSSEYIKTINGRLPNPVTGDIVVIEGGGSSSYGAYRIDATIAVSDWVLTNGVYRVTITSNDMADIITSNMDGSETWLDDETAMLGETTFTTFGTGSGDGGIYVDTTVLPTASWGLHILLAMNGADMLSDMTSKIEDAKAIIGSGISIIVDGDTATSAIAPGEYAYIENNTHGLAEGVYYNSSSSTFPVSGGTANSSVFSIPSKGGLNQLGSTLNSNKVNKTIELSAGTDLNNVVTSGFYRLLNNHTNAPTVRDCSWSQMIVSRGNDTILQMIGQNSDNRWFVRAGHGIGGSNPTWTSWEELALNSKIVSYKNDASSLDELKSDILTFANTLSVNDVRNYSFWVGASISPFSTGYIYAGHITITAKSSNSLRFSGVFTCDNGDSVSVGYNNGAWKIERLALNSTLSDYSSVDAVKYGSLWESGIIRAHRRGYVVTFKLDGMTIASVSGGRQQIGTIPEGYRPVTEISFYDDTKTRQFIITSSGVIQAATQSAGQMWGAVTYVCNR